MAEERERCEKCHADHEHILHGRDIAELLEDRHTANWFALQCAAAAEIRRLRSEVAGYKRWASSVDEALNTGDGSYRP